MIKVGIIYVLLFLVLLNPAVADFPSNMVVPDILSEVSPEFSVNIEVISESAFHDKVITPHHTNVYDV